MNALNVSYSSSVVSGGHFSPSFSTHGWYTHSLAENWQWKQFASTSGNA